MLQIDLNEKLEMLRVAFDEAPGFMALTRGRDHCFVLVNQEFQRITGVDPTGRKLAEALPFLEAQGIGAMLDNVLETGQPFVARSMKVRVLDDDGGWRDRIVDFTSSLVSHASEGGDILCLGIDVTDRVHAQRQALQLQHELTRVARTAAFGTMAATLAHELNQPLTAAIAFLSGARRIVSSLPGADGTKAPEAIDLAEEAIQRAGEIVRQARRAVSEVTGVRQAVTMSSMVHDAVRLLEAADVLDNVKVQIAIDPVTIAVWVNEIQIEQVLINLIRNACEAMDGLQARVLSIEVVQEGGMASCQISDTGCGLGPMEDGFRSFNSSKSNLGLGLALSRTIVEAHGGRISIANRPSGGVTVCLSLPLAEQT